MQSLRCRELCLSSPRHPGTPPQHRMPHTISFSEWWRVQAVRGSGVWVWRSGASALFACPNCLASVHLRSTACRRPLLSLKRPCWQAVRGSEALRLATLLCPCWGVFWG